MLSRAALAERWLTTPGRLANLAYQGKGPSLIRLGTRVLYPLSAVVEYEDARRVEMSVSA